DLTDLIIKQLRYRNFILCSLGGNAFAFVHRTFLEYFCACEFYERFKKRGLPDGITLEELKTKVFGEHYSDPVWKEVLCLLMGMLSAEFPKEIAEELISYLIDIEEKDQEFAYLFLAADCYGELRNQSIYVKLSQRLLNQLERLYDKDISYYEKYDSEKWWQQRDKIRDKNISSVVKNWQGDPNGWNMLQKLAQSATSWPEQKPVINALVEIAQLYPVALSKIQELANRGKSKAIEALATHWRDNPQTLPIIQQQANKGQSKAIEALANHWRDNPQTLPIIQQQANKGEHRAIEALANHWRDDPQTLPIIQQLANKAEGEIIGLLTALARIKIDSEIGAIIETILARTDVDAKIKEGFQEFLYYSNFRDWRNPD
ncbi:MAG: signal transduction protein, partial [Microcystis sp.]